MRKFSCLVAVAMAIGCGDDEPRTEFDAGPETDMSGLDMSGLDMEMPMVDMGDTPVDMGDTPIDMGGDTADMGDTPDMGEGVDMFTPAPTCDDGLRNGDETGVDCGGETCELRCPEGAMCSISADCASETCFGGTCQATRCDDPLYRRRECRETEALPVVDDFVLCHVQGQHLAILCHIHQCRTFNHE